MSILEIASVFVSGFVLDAFYVVWLRNVEANKPFRSALASLALTAPALFGTVNVIGNHFLSVPYLLGIALGTFIAVKYYKVRDTITINIGADDPANYSTALDGMFKDLNNGK